MRHSTASQGSSAVCSAPRADISSPATPVPQGAVDCHAHVIDANRYPLISNPSYVPAFCPEYAYRNMLQRTGMSRGVLVQPSIYGADNRHMLEALSLHPGKLRGVAVISEDTSDEEMTSMHTAGVRGVRFNTQFEGGLSISLLEKIAAKIQRFGWHIEFLVKSSDIPQIRSALEQVDTPIVFAHLGFESFDSDISNFVNLIEFYADNRVWVKCSAFNRLVSGSSYAPVVPRIQQLLEISDARCVWGSDWPHVAVRSQPDTGAMLNTMIEALGDESTAHRVFVENPEILYSFDKINF